MPYGNFVSPAQVAKRYQIVLTRATFVEPLPVSISEYFRGELAFVQENVPFNNSEFAICEGLIYPILKEIWKPYSNELTLWGHQPLNCDEDLCGTPDYFVARRSPLGVSVQDEPYLMIMEAKKDDFEYGWGQCLAAMVAVQRMNGHANQIIYGIVTNGKTWEFGKLLGQVYTLDAHAILLDDLDKLCAAINFMFESCRRQLAVLAKAS